MYAQRALGLLYNKGKEVPQNFNKANEFLTLAAAQNDSSALYSLGINNEKGQGTTQNFPEAFRLYEKAVTKRKHIASHYKIGYFYYRGKGVERNFKKAATIFEFSNQKK